MSARPQQRPSRLARSVAIAAAILFTSVGLAAAHDMFIKPTRFFAPENSEVRLRLLNGTFVLSENAIARNRLADASYISPRGRVQLDTTEWGVRGDTSTFHIHTREAGTYVVGVSTKPSEIDLSGDDFNLYLESDGIPDVLAARRRDGELGVAVRERYHKHVKSLIQVGTARSDLYSRAMGYPAELIPIENPYTLRPGATIQLRVLVDGRPVANQLVQYGGESSNGTRFAQQDARSDANGIVRVPLATAGAWYVKFIHMARLTSGPVNYESKWASLTFEVR